MEYLSPHTLSMLLLSLLIMMIIFELPLSLSSSSLLSGGKCRFPAIFNFGDSNSDTGGLVAAFGPQPPPHGMTFFHKPSGRFCDGRLLIDFIANAVGRPYLDAYLQSVGSNFKHGANFATAGSTILRQNTTLSQSGFSPFSLDVQISQFVEFQQRAAEHYKEYPYNLLLPEPEDFKKSLYTLDIGQNDLTSPLFRNYTLEQVKAYLPGVLIEYASHIKTLYALGGRNFLIMATAPLGCLPYVLFKVPQETSQLDRHGCSIPLNLLARNFNMLLLNMVEELRKELPDAVFLVADNYMLKYELFENAHEDGFRFTMKACCGYGGDPYNFSPKIGCGVTVIEGGVTKSYNLCKNPSQYISWDGVHFTEASNHILAQGLLSGNYTTPNFSSGQLCSVFNSPISPKSCLICE